MKLSLHFTLAELTVTDTGLPNQPAPEHLANLRLTAYGLELVRFELGGFPLIVTSAYRSAGVNKAVGGVPTSAHALGFAADWRSQRYAPLEAAQRIADSKILFDQLILEGSRRVVHISFDPRLRRQVLSQPGAAGSPVVPGLRL